MTDLRSLPELNTNYDPPQPWRCIPPAEHVCSGPVVGAVGAYPVCQAGAVAEQVRRDEENARLAAWMAQPEVRTMLDAEAARERYWEGRVS